MSSRLDTLPSGVYWWASHKAWAWVVADDGGRFWVKVTASHRLLEKYGPHETRESAEVALKVMLAGDIRRTLANT